MFIKNDNCFGVDNLYIANLENHNKLGKFAIINTVQYQKKEQNIELNELETLNVPEWLTRNTLLFSTDAFNKSLYLQTGITFNYFTKFYADYYNPLISEFVTQNYKMIGDYPRFDFFVNVHFISFRFPNLLYIYYRT